MKVCPLCNRRYSDDRKVCRGDGTLLREIDPIDLDETTNRLSETPSFVFEDPTKREVPEKDSVAAGQGRRRGRSRRAVAELVKPDQGDDDEGTTNRVEEMPPLLEVELVTSVDESPPAAVLDLDATLPVKQPNLNEALKPLPIASPRSGDHELDDDETEPVEGPTNVVDADVPTRVAEPDSELLARLDDAAPDPLPPIKDADRIIEAAQRRVASERIQHQLEQLKAGKLAPTPEGPKAAVDDAKHPDDDEYRSDGKGEEEATPIVVPTAKRDAEDDTVKVASESVVLPPHRPIQRLDQSGVSTEKVSALVVEEEPSAVIPLARAPVPTEIAVPLPPPRPSRAIFWVTLLIVALVCLGAGFVLGRASV